MRNKNQDISGQEGKLQPQEIELEEIVLGALMLERTAIDSVAEILIPDVFYKEPHQLIYSAILSLWQSSEPIDIATVTSYIRKLGKLEIVGGAYYITSLTNRVASSANISTHAAIIYDKYVQRQLISISHSMGSKSFRDDVDVKSIIEEVENSLSELYGNLVGSNVTGDIKPVLTDIRKSFDNPEQKELTGLDTGNSKINSITGGLQNNNLVILAARPGVGKSARALKIAASAWLSQGKKGAIFSLEMSKKQMVQRLISEAGRFNGKLFRTQAKATDQDLHQLMKGIGAVHDYGIEIYDKAAINVNFVRSICKKFKKKHGTLDYIIIDYLQLMTVPYEKKQKNREQEVSEISKSLKNLAKEFDIPVIALAQLSRDLEKRSDKRPVMADLRESGSIEQDADIVWFLYRPANYYDLSNDPDYGKDQEPTVNDLNYHRLTESLIAKHRDGDAGDIVLEEFIGEHMAFKDWNESYALRNEPFRPNVNYTDHPFGQHNYEQPPY